MDENLLEKLAGIITGSDSKEKVPLGSLSEEDRKLYDELETLSDKIKALEQERSTRRSFFWSKIEMQLGRFDLSLHYDKDSGILYELVEKKNGID